MNEVPQANAGGSLSDIQAIAQETANGRNPWIRPDYRLKVRTEMRLRDQSFQTWLLAESARWHRGRAAVPYIREIEQ